MEERSTHSTQEQETAGWINIDEPVMPLNIAPAPRSGDTCPSCGRGKLDYDGMLNLSCPECGYSLGGCFT